MKDVIVWTIRSAMPAEQVAEISREIAERHPGSDVWVAGWDANAPVVRELRQGIDWRHVGYSLLAVMVGGAVAVLLLAIAGVVR